ncbi:MAG: hypothetical protein MRERV_39c029 [Mycoplasmataceae bacterium RV_VA103A]|nr:MAG: hypothetical protein MRERV_39c029 [Mycoplasmataceae bacterium RV_VA103A]
MTENLKEIQENMLANSSNEVPTNQQQQKVEKNLITLKGTTTSRVEQALKGSKTNGQHPYPARVFLQNLFLQSQS